MVANILDCGCIRHIDGYDLTYWKYKGLYSVFMGLIMLLVMLQPVIKLMGSFKLQRQLVVSKNSSNWKPLIRQPMPSNWTRKSI